MDRFGRAHIDAGLAVDAHIFVDLCLVILHRDGRRRTFAYAGFTSGTFTVVNDCYQSIHSIVILGKRQKKGFDVTSKIPESFPGLIREKYPEKVLELPRKKRK